MIQPVFSASDYEKEIKRIGTLNFFDIYISEDGKTGTTRSTDQTNENSYHIKEIEQEYIEDLTLLAKECKQIEALNHQEYSIKYDHVNYRASLIKSQGGVYRVLRKQPSEIRKLNTLKLHQHVVELLMLKKLRGLVLISGTTGSGKTTTASSIVVERLMRYGGIGYTVEDPPEMPLQDIKYENAQCFQTFADADAGGYPGALKRALRFTPDIIFLGEIRDADTAKEAIKASVTGHLIIATIHAGNITQSIDRLISMANTDEYRSLLAEGLSFVIQQTRVGKSVNFKILSLIDTGKTVTGPGIRHKIKRSETHSIHSDSESQMNRLLAGQEL